MIAPKVSVAALAAGLAWFSRSWWPVVAALPRRARHLRQRDFIGIATTAAAAVQDCSAHTATGVGSSASEIIMWIRQNPGPTTSGQQQVTVGGLHGQVLDIRMTTGGTHACRSPGGSEPEVPLLVGTGTSNFNHGITAGVAERLYLLDFSGAALSIEIVDISGGAHLDTYSAIVNELQFAT